MRKHPLPGRRFTFWGREISFRYHPGVQKKKISLKFAEDTLNVEADPSLDLSDEFVYKKFLKSQAALKLIPLAEHIASNQGFSPSSIKLSSGNTRWGSCTSKGVVSLNFMLTALSQEIIEYVIIHEFCHLRHLNHSKQFWEEVSKFVPDYKEIRKKLKGLML